MGLVDLVRPCDSWGLGLLKGQDEGADVSVKQLHPLDRLGPQVQIPLLEQEVLFILVNKQNGSLVTGMLMLMLISIICGFVLGHLGETQEL